MQVPTPPMPTPSPPPAVSPEGPANTGTPAPTSSPTTTTPSPAPAPISNGPLRVHYVNVGQGDGTIWELPDGTLVVYDCGEGASSTDPNPMVVKLRALGYQSGARIHALIASHGHLDHIGGCEGILSEYYVTHLYEAWYDGGDAPGSYTRFRDQVKSEGGTIHTLRDTTSVSGEVVLGQWEYLDLPADSGVKAQLAWPATFATSDWESIAESSLVIRLTHGTTAFCFQGDIETAQENALASYSQDLSCDVHLVGHHGSKYASASSWLSKMDPEHAVVSFGTNSYGHPTSEALCRIQRVGATVYATHRAGDIAFASDGTTVTTNATAETLNYCTVGVSYWGGTPAASPTPSSTPTPSPTPAPTPSTPPATSGPSAPFAVTASMSDSTPCRYSTVSVYVHAVGANGVAVSGASVSSSWHYKSNTSSESGTTNANGDATLSRSISSATAGYTVQVNVQVNLGGTTGTASTSFTPVTC